MRSVVDPKFDGSFASLMTGQLRKRQAARQWVLVRHSGKVVKVLAQLGAVVVEGVVRHPPWPVWNVCARLGSGVVHGHF